MPQREDLITLLKRLLAQEDTEGDTNEVLDELLNPRETLTLSDAVVITESSSPGAVVGTSTVGFCEVG